MAGKIQVCKTILIPELGLDLEPEFVLATKIDTDFSRVIAHLAAKTGSRTIMLEATSDGRLLSASAGTSNEIYEVNAGAAPNAYNAGSTYEYVLAQYVTDILVETNDATISFRNVNGVWGNDKSIPIGFASIDFIHYGIRIQNRVAAAVADYEITSYR